MRRLLVDENFNGYIVRGLLRRRPGLDLVRVQDVGLVKSDDPTILAWAALHGYILLTHDRATVPEYAYDRVVAGEPMPGIFLLNDRMPPRQAIDELLLLDECSEQEEWNSLVVYLPLSEGGSPFSSAIYYQRKRPSSRFLICGSDQIMKVTPSPPLSLSIQRPTR